MPPSQLYGWACVAHSVAEILSHAAEIRARQAAAVAAARTTAVQSHFTHTPETVHEPSRSVGNTWKDEKSPTLVSESNWNSSNLASLPGSSLASELSRQMPFTPVRQLAHDCRLTTLIYGSLEMLRREGILLHQICMYEQQTSLRLQRLSHRKVHSFPQTAPWRLQKLKSPCHLDLKSICKLLECHLLDSVGSCIMAD